MRWRSSCLRVTCAFSERSARKGRTQI
jgi:hypothetical protein